MMRDECCDVDDQWVQECSQEYIRSNPSLLGLCAHWPGFRPMTNCGCGCGCDFGYYWTANY